MQSAADIEQYSALLRIRRSERPAPSATGRAGRPPNQRQRRLSRGCPDPVQTTTLSESAAAQAAASDRGMYYLKAARAGDMQAEGPGIGIPVRPPTIYPACRRRARQQLEGVAGARSIQVGWRTQRRPRGLQPATQSPPALRPAIRRRDGGRGGDGEPEPPASGTWIGYGGSTRRAEARGAVERGASRATNRGPTIATNLFQPFEPLAWLAIHVAHGPMAAGYPGRAAAAGCQSLPASPGRAATDSDRAQ